jgi:hypothetical protein
MNDGVPRDHNRVPRKAMTVPCIHCAKGIMQKNMHKEVLIQIDDGQACSQNNELNRCRPFACLRIFSEEYLPSLEWRVFPTKLLGQKMT